MSHIPDRQESDRPGDLLLHYRSSKKKIILVMILLSFGLAVLALLSCMTGPMSLSLHDLCKGLAGHGRPGIVLWQIRIPRTLSAIASGLALGLSGALIQILLKNPLASPSTLGISHGAAFGAAFAIVILKAPASAIVSVTGLAFTGAILATLLIIGISTIKHLGPQAMVLAGVAFSSLFMAATILVQFMASEIELASVVFWTFGDITRSTMAQTGTVFSCFIVVFFFFIMNHWNLKTLFAGEESARALGVRVTRLRITGMLLAAMVAAAVTAFCGVIAFLGLLAPHIAKYFSRDNQALRVPMASLCGALLLLTADIVIRLIVPTTRLPVGILTSFMGAPLFLLLLIGRNKYA